MKRFTKKTIWWTVRGYLIIMILGLLAYAAMYADVPGSVNFMMMR